MSEMNCVTLSIVTEFCGEGGGLSERGISSSKLRM
jgi:hypothetical protein